MRQLTILTLLTMSIWSCAQSKTVTPKLVGGPCEGCEAVFEFDGRILNSIDTLPDFIEDGPQIKISGTVYEYDGITPAPGVIIYIHHTNQDGYYPPDKNAQGWGRRHGRLRGWMKTDQNGHYEYYTLKPGPYPGRSDPMHIHYTIFEPNGKYYWIQDVIFSGDPRIKNYQPNEARGGDGLVELIKKDGLLIGTRHVILGRNIESYEN